MTTPKLSLKAGANPVEGGAVGSFVVELSEAATFDFTVYFKTTGSATLWTDYTLSAGTNTRSVGTKSFTMLKGQTTATLNVTAQTDKVLDPNETVQLSLTEGYNYQLDTIKNLSFAPPVDYFVRGAEHLDIGDYNRDGLQDLFVTGSTVSVLLNKEAGDFSGNAILQYDTGRMTKSVSVGYLGNDDLLDLATISFYEHGYSSGMKLWVDIGTESGFIRSLEPYFDPTSPELDPSLRLRYPPEYIGDGAIDGSLVSIAADTNQLVVADGGVISIWSNDNGVWNPQGGGYLRRSYTYGVKNDIGAMGLGDFNNDGVFDIVVSQDNGLSVLLSNQGRYYDRSIESYNLSKTPQSISSGDFNNDGKLDLVVACGQTISVLLRNAANNGFEPKIDYTIDFYPDEIKVADFNDDGLPDLAILNQGKSIVSVLMNNTKPSATLTISDTPVVIPGTGIKTGTNGYDYLVGTNGADQIDGLAGNDTIKGLDGADTLFGGLGLDFLNGGKGSDTVDYTYATSNLKITLDSSGWATVNVGAGDVDTLAAIENLIGGSGNDILTGNSLANVLKGGAGNDILNGGKGNDILTGGAGADTFVFSVLHRGDANKDIITDFNRAEGDKIKLANVFTAFSGMSAITNDNLVIGSEASGTNDFLIYNPTTGQLFYDADGIGNQFLNIAPLEIALIGNKPAWLLASDFIF